MARCMYDWGAAAQYRAQGHSIEECSRRFGFHVTAWYKAIERGVIPRPPRQNPGARLRYDWDAIQRYYDEGHTYRECKADFGFAAESWRLAVARGRITSRGQRWTLEKLLREGKRTSNIKKRLIEAGVLKDECSRCGLSEWLGRKLVIQMDHINGICTDNRLENFRMLCPNCHSQTETFGGRNKASIRKNVGSRASNAAPQSMVAPAGFEPALLP
jgi:hypothetical protein